MLPQYKQAPENLNISNRTLKKEKHGINVPVDMQPLVVSPNSCWNMTT